MTSDVDIELADPKAAYDLEKDQQITIRYVPAFVAQAVQDASGPRTFSSIANERLYRGSASP
jgi:hypothetical protein